MKEPAPAASRLSADAEAAPLAAGWMSREEAIMGTAVHVELWHEDRAAGTAAIDAVMGEMRRIDELMSPFKAESELSRVNRDAARAPVPIGAELFGLIERSIDFSRLSEGVFDITFASVGSLFDYRQRIKPTEADLAAALPALNYRHLLLDPAQRSIRFAHPRVQIDLGGIAKGHAVDSSIALLRARGVQHALVMAGGDSRVLGDRRGRPWMIGIRDPRRADAVTAVVPLVDAAISTSGDYERFFEVDGVRHHHIIDPATGRSALGVHSVSIIGPDTTMTEGLSKTVFIQGTERGLRLIESLDGVAAVVIDDDGKMHYSSGLHRPESAPR